MRKVLGLSILALSTLLACKSITLAATPNLVVPAPEINILNEALQDFKGCMSETGVTNQENTYSFSCRNSADTSYSVSMTHFNSQALARTQFDSGRAENPTLCFHGYLLYESSSQNPNNRYIVQEKLVWQAREWVVLIRASYDYGYAHYTARSFAEAVYTSSLEHALFSAGACP